MIDRRSRLYIAGHRGIVGSALLRKARAAGFSDVITATRDELDLRSQPSVEAFFDAQRPGCMFIAAAKVGGIAANIASPVEFLVENLQIQNNLLLAAKRFGVKKTMFLGSSCVYPRECPQPMREEYLMTGPLEPTNENYALAKIAGIKLAQSLFRQYGTLILNPMPCNVYGPGDHFEFERSHVVSAMVRRFSEAVASSSSSITLWGTGTARRELLHVDDLAEACFFLMDNSDDPEIINVGSGEDLSIKELAEIVAEMTGFTGNIEWDHSKPDGMPRKVLDVTRINALGWKHRIDLRTGLGTVIDDYRKRYGQPR